MTIEAVATKPKAGRTNGIDRALQIMDFLQLAGEPRTAYEIAHGINAPLSSVYSIIDHLIEVEILARGEGGATWLGPRLYYYGLAYERSLDLLAQARAEMSTLARECGESVQICFRDGGDMVVAAMESGSDQFNISSREGTRTPLNWSASGRLLVGHMDRHELVKAFKSFARKSPTGRAEMRAEVFAEEARQSLSAGYCIQAGESDFAVACVAAPIIDRAGICQATISIVVPEQKIERSKAELIALVSDSADRVRRRLGWSI